MAIRAMCTAPVLESVATVVPPPFDFHIRLASPVAKLTQCSFATWFLRVFSDHFFNFPPLPQIGHTRPEELCPLCLPQGPVRVPVRCSGLVIMGCTLSRCFSLICLLNYSRVLYDMLHQLQLIREGRLMCQRHVSQQHVAFNKACRALLTKELGGNF